MCFLLIYLQKGFKVSLHLASTNTFVWARRNLSFEFYYKQEEQFSLTVKCNNWLPIFVLWPRHYFVFLVIVLTFY